MEVLTSTRYSDPNRDSHFVHSIPSAPLSGDEFFTVLGWLAKAINGNGHIGFTYYENKFHVSVGWGGKGAWWTEGDTLPAALDAAVRALFPSETPERPCAHCKAEPGANHDPTCPDKGETR